MARKKKAKTDPQGDRPSASQHKARDFPTEEVVWAGRTRRVRSGIVNAAFIPAGSSDNQIDAKRDELLAFVGGTESVYSRAGRWVAIRIPEELLKETSLVDVALALDARDDVRFAAPDFVCRALMPGVGGAANGWHHSTIRTIEAWELERGQPNVLIAVIDSGIAVDAAGAVKHEDLDGTRFRLGYDYIDEDEIPGDENCHGTWIAGVLAAKGEHDERVHGLNKVSPLYVCRVMGKGLGLPTPSPPEGAESFVAKALDHVVCYFIGYKQAKELDNLVVNLSLAFEEEGCSGESTTPLLSERLRAVSDRGDVIVCCATGNVYEEKYFYPAAMSLELEHAVVAVGGIMENKSPWTAGGLGSTYGDHVSVVAPAESIWTTYPEELLIASGATTGYGTAQATSIATPFVTGLASLIWSHCPNVTASSVVACIKKAAVLPTDTDYSEEELRKRYGNGIIDMYAAIPHAEVDNSPITFVEVAPGEPASVPIGISIKSCIDLDFEVEVLQKSWADGDDVLIGAVPVTYVPGGAPDEFYHFAGLALTFRAGDPGVTVNGKVLVKCHQFGPGWNKNHDKEIVFTASTSLLNTHVVLVADTSASMSNTTVGTFTRMDVLKAAAKILVQDLPVNSAMSVVKFSTDADLQIGVTPIHQNTESADRIKLEKAINMLNVDGLTSIGDGVELAQDVIQGTSGFGNEAMIVITDGHETAEKSIAEVMPLIKSDVYAVAMGAPGAVDTGALGTLASKYLLLTGNLDGGAVWMEDVYRLGKYFIQILTDVKNEDIILDPLVAIRSGAPVEVPFTLTTSDSRADVIVMMPHRDIVTVGVEGPRSGAMAAAPSIGDHATIRRIVPPTGNLHAGKWKVILSVNEDVVDRFADILDERQRHLLDAHGVFCNLLITTRSALRMRCTLSQVTTIAPASIELRAFIFDHGTPLNQASARVYVRRPDGGQDVTALRRTPGGVFEGTYRADLPGVYESRFQITGFNHAHQPFTREQVRTGFVHSSFPRP